MESKRSCCSRVTCCGMAMETGCFVFAIINAVIVSLCALGCIGFVGLVLNTWLDPHEAGARGSNDMLLVWLFTGLCIACCVGTAIALTFAVLLCIGLSKKNPRYVMAYLVYGIITENLSVMGIIGFIWMEWDELPLIAYSSIFVGACVVYAFLLLLVYRTYVVFSALPPLVGHRKLINNEHLYDC